METVYIKQNQRKQLGITLIAAFMWAICLIILYNGIKRNLLYELIWGSIGLVFFSICFVYIIRHLIKPKDLVIIDEKGVTDASTMLAVGFVSWSDVEKVERVRVTNEEFVGVYLHPEDADILKKRLPKSKAKNIEMNQMMKWPEININVKSAEQSIEEVERILKTYLEAYKNKAC